jgi:flagellar assembly protein FliH
MTTEQESPQQESPADQRPSVKTFRPTTFELCQFEVIAKGGDLSNFAATDFACVEKTVQVSDPMFEVFDDIEASPVSEDLAADSEAATENSELGGQVGVSEEESVETEFADGEEITEYVRELKQEVARLEEERTALEEEHARQLEELRTQVSQEVRQEVEKESAERVKAVEERYATLIEDMNTQIQEGIDGVERRALEFALQVAKKLVGTTVEVNPEYILGIIKEATKLTGGATIKAIRVSPQDLEFLKMLSPDKQFKEFDGSWSFQADETIHAGCVVETSSGQVELDLDKAWEKIKESVIKVR